MEAMPTTANPRHTASRAIKALPAAIYDAFVHREALERWLPPEGATGAIHAFEPRAGGRFSMTLTFASAPGKSSVDTDVVEGRFVELQPGRRIVQVVEFASPDPDFAGAMTMTWTFTATPDGSFVTIVAEDVPLGVSQADHESGMASTLENLARFVE